MLTRVFLNRPLVKGVFLLLTYLKFIFIQNILLISAIILMLGTSSCNSHKEYFLKKIVP